MKKNRTETENPGPCRAKSKTTGEWTEGFPIAYPCGNDSERRHFIVPNGTEYAPDMPMERILVEIDQNTLCWYVGKRDTEGKPIFSHDIVSYIDTYSTDSGYAEMDCIGEVLWEPGELCVYVTERLSAESWEVLDECLVIGNGFDEPELLDE